MPATWKVVANRTAAFAVVVLCAIACADDSESVAISAIETRANDLLELLRARNWDATAEFVLVDEVTRVRMAIPAGASAETSREIIGRWFEALYRNVPPGDVISIEISRSDPAFATVTYRAGDIDTFNMRLVNEQWYYTLEWRSND